MSLFDYLFPYRGPDGTLVAKATAATIVLWVLGTIGRLVFGLYAQHGGGPAIAEFSRAHGIAFAAWGAALILMALCEVMGRTLVLAGRALLAGSLSDLRRSVPEPPARMPM